MHIMLAHGGAGATWQALLVLLSFGMVAVVAGAVAGRIPLDEPGDLVLPLAATALLASLSGATSSILSDWVGWWFPVGVVALLAMVVAAFTSAELSIRSPLLVTAAVVAVGAALALHVPIAEAWHPIDGLLRDDVSVAITSPVEGDVVPVGPLSLTVAVDGGSVGPGPTTGVRPDPEELGQVVAYVDGIRVDGPDGAALQPREACDDGCSSVTFDVPLERGAHVLSVEFLTSHGQSFATTAAGAPTVALVAITAE